MVEILLQSFSIAFWRPSSNASTKTGAASLPPLPPSWARPDEATLPLQRVCDSLLLDAEISERDTVCQAMVGSKLKLMINKRAFEFVLRFCFVCILSASSQRTDRKKCTTLHQSRSRPMQSIWQRKRPELLGLHIVKEVFVNWFILFPYLVHSF